MRTIIEQTYGVCVLRWDEYDEDLGVCIFEGYVAGALVRAESLALFLSAIQERTGLALEFRLAA